MLGLSKKRVEKKKKTRCSCVQWDRLNNGVEEVKALMVADARGNQALEDAEDGDEIALLGGDDGRSLVKVRTDEADEGGHIGLLLPQVR